MIADTSNNHNYPNSAIIETGVVIASNDCLQDTLENSKSTQKNMSTILR